jgi:hypothetical protein
MARRKVPSRTASTTPVPLKYPISAELQRAFDRVAVIALRLPGVEVSRAYGTPALKVKGKPLARLRTEAEGGFALRCDFVDRQMLLQADPDVFYVTDHYLDHPMVLIDLTRVRWDAMPYLVLQGWRLVAPPKLVREYDASGAGT